MEFNPGDEVWIMKDPSAGKIEYERAVISKIFGATCIVRLRDAYGQRMIPVSWIKPQKGWTVDNNPNTKG